jgi:hypothetical protein
MLRALNRPDGAPMGPDGAGSAAPTAAPLARSEAQRALCNASRTGAGQTASRVACAACNTLLFLEGSSAMDARSDCVAVTATPNTTNFPA